MASGGMSRSSRKLEMRRPLSSMTGRPPASRPRALPICGASASKSSSMLVAPVARTSRASNVFSGGMSPTTPRGSRWPTTTTDSSTSSAKYSSAGTAASVVAGDDGGGSAVCAKAGTAAAPARSRISLGDMRRETFETSNCSRPCPPQPECRIGGRGNSISGLDPDEGWRTGPLSREYASRSYDARPMIRRLIADIAWGSGAAVVRHVTRRPPVSFEADAIEDAVVARLPP